MSITFSFRHFLFFLQKVLLIYISILYFVLFYLSFLGYSILISTIVLCLIFVFKLYCYIYVFMYVLLRSCLNVSLFLYSSLYMSNCHCINTFCPPCCIVAMYICFNPHPHYLPVWSSFLFCAITSLSCPVT